MKTLPIFCLFLFSNLVVARSDWVNDPIGSCTQRSELKKIDVSDVAEVQHSRFEVAKQKLQNLSIVEVTENLASWYSGRKIQNSGEARFYLVRAVFGHGGTGGFSVFNCDGNLLISHHSLGNRQEPKESALIVKLTSPPKNVYVKFSIHK